jgi:hypothetical protein
MTYVMVGTPVGGGVVSHDYLHGVLALQRHFSELGWRHEIVTIPDGLVTRSRNAFASTVVRNPEVTHLLMLDADVVVAPEGLERLVRADHDVCGAVVALRQVGWARVRAHLDVCADASAAELRAIANEHAVQMLPDQRPVDGFIPVRSIGSAAMLISRAALVELSRTSLVQRIDHGLAAPDGESSGWTFFDPIVDDHGVYLSEDYAFCERWRSTGGTVWADLRTPTRHIGPVAVEGDIGRSLAAATRAVRARRSTDHGSSELQ